MGFEGGIGEMVSMLEGAGEVDMARREDGDGATTGAEPRVGSCQSEWLKVESVLVVSGGRMFSQRRSCNQRSREES